MIQLNKYQRHIKSLATGSKLTFEKLIVQDSENNFGNYPNDIIEGQYIGSEKKEGMRIWIRHFLDECEIENGLSMIVWINEQTDEKGQVKFPDSIEIIGYNESSNKVIVRPKG
ncbi:MAG: hypothetical protein ABJG68_01570 [Crocinitomicaceae bacterium]